MIDYMLMEAVTLKVQKEDEKAQKDAERKQQVAEAKKRLVQEYT